MKEFPCMYHLDISVWFFKLMKIRSILMFFYYLNSENFDSLLVLLVRCSDYSIAATFFLPCPYRTEAYMPCPHNLSIENSAPSAEFAIDATFSGSLYP